MTRINNQQFKEADAAVERAVSRFMSEIDRLRRNCLTGKWDEVYPSYLIDRTLLQTCDALAKLIDNGHLADIISPAALKLSNALADYRDAPATERVGFGWPTR